MPRKREPCKKIGSSNDIFHVLCIISIINSPLALKRLTLIYNSNYKYRKLSSRWYPSRSLQNSWNMYVWSNVYYHTYHTYYYNQIFSKDQCGYRKGHRIHNHGHNIMLYQIFLSAQVKRSEIISNNLVYTSWVTRWQTS